MKNCIKILLVIPLFLFTACNIDDVDDLSNDMAIRMSVSVEHTKALITEENIENSSIGIYGYKEQISNQDNKFLVFDNQLLSFSGTWNYTPVRYWDTQTAYSFIAYAPYEESAENIRINGFESISINNIPQWQDADAVESKDYVVALTDSAATNYINNGGVDLKFHHILANLKISAFKEGESEFKIQSITIGADEDGQRVPAFDAVRTFTQYFRTTGLDADQKPTTEFSSVILQGDGVELMNRNQSITAESALVANNLVAPFVAGAELQLIISYTENGEAKSANVNSGITEFQSDAVYTINLKFISTVADDPTGPSGPGVEVVKDGFAIGDGDFKYCLAIGDDGELKIADIGSISVNQLIWYRDDCDNGKFLLSCVYNNITYYLSEDGTDNHMMIVTENVENALEFYQFQYQGKNPNLATDIDGVQYLVKHTQYTDKSIVFFLSKESDSAAPDGYESIAPSEFTMLSGMNICKVENGYAGPLIYFESYTNQSGNFDYLNKVLSPSSNSLVFNLMMTDVDFSILGFFQYNNWKSNFYWENSNDVNNRPVNYLNQYNSDVDVVSWTVTKEDGTVDNDFTDKVSINGDKTSARLNYSNAFQEDTNIIVTAKVKFKDGTERVSTYGIILKGANSN